MHRMKVDGELDFYVLLLVHKYAQIRVFQEPIYMSLMLLMFHLGEARSW